MDTIGFIGDMLVLLGTSVLLIVLLAAMIQMLRSRRRQYVCTALAVWAWALWLWAATAEKYPIVRDGIGSLTLVLLQWVAVIIFALLVVRVLQVVWNWPPIALRFTRRLP